MGMKKYYDRATRQAFYNEQVIEQNNRCGICGRQGRLVIDHNHTTGVFRGILCMACNGGLGMFQDNPALLSMASVYLWKRSYQASTWPEPGDAPDKVRPRIEPRAENPMVVRIWNLINDQSFSSDRARGRQLAAEFNISIEAANKRIGRAKRAGKMTGKTKKLSQPTFPAEVV